MGHVQPGPTGSRNQEKPALQTKLVSFKPQLHKPGFHRQPQQPDGCRPAGIPTVGTDLSSAGSHRPQ